MTERKRVLFAQIKHSGYDRSVADGVAAFVRRHGHWMVAHVHVDAPLIPEVARWYPGTKQRVFDGILIRHAAEGTRPTFFSTFKCPVVEIEHLRNPSAEHPCVLPDYIEAGRQAAVHFLSLGFRHFAACISSRQPYQQKRWEGFRDGLRAAGHEAVLLDIDQKNPSRKITRRTRIKQLADWLRKQPRPLALLFGWIPSDGRLLEACDYAGLRIPEDIAVIAIGVSTVPCDLSWPTLTTVDLNLHTVGFQAAAQLDRLMRGATDVPGVTYIPPVGVIPRMSTDVVAVEDDVIVAATRLMRESAPIPLSVDDVAARVGVGRRTLELRFRKALGRSPSREMRRLRIEHAKEMLRSSREKITAVARHCGYRNYGDFLRAFQAAEGTSPTAYRARFP